MRQSNLTTEELDRIIDSLPGGMTGYMKAWGLYQYGRLVEKATRRAIVDHLRAEEGDDEQEGTH